MVRVFEIVRGSGPVTRQQIGELSGLSKPTVNEALDALLEGKLIYLGKAKVESIGGKPGPKAQQIFYNGSRLKIIGIDIGGSRIRELISDLDGNIIASSRSQTPHSGGRIGILKEIAEITAKMLEDSRLKISDIGVIVVGTPGTVNPETGTVTIAHNMPDWNNFPLAKELSKLLKTEVLVENEAHLAIYGENWKGSAKKINNAAAMSIGVGIGLGLLIDGKVYRGFNGIAGEVGNLPLQITSAKSPATNANYEYQASAAGLERNFHELQTKTEAKEIIALANGEAVTAKLIYAAASTGNELAIKLVDQQLELLSRGIASVCCITNPEIFILHGGLAPSLVPHLKTIAKKVGQIALVPPRIVVSELSDLSTTYGALRRGIEKVDRETLTAMLQKSA